MLRFKNFFTNLRNEPIKAIGIINIVSSLVFLFVSCYFLYYSVIGFLSIDEATYFEQNPIVSSIAINSIPLLIAAINFYLGLKILRGHREKWANVASTILAIIFLIVPVLLLGSIGAFFLWLSVIVILLTLLLSSSLWNKKRHISIVLVVLVISANMAGFSWGFEEDYCSGIGSLADPSGMETVTLPASESSRYMLGESEAATSSTVVGQAWKSHVECHETFDLKAELKDKYHLPI